MPIHNYRQPYSWLFIMPNDSIGVTQRDYMRRLLPYIVRKKPYFSMKNPDYRLPLPPISRCQQKGIVTIQALYQSKSQGNNRFQDIWFFQGSRYNGNIMTFKKHVRLFFGNILCSLSEDEI